MLEAVLITIWGTNRSENPATKDQNKNLAKSSPVLGYVFVKISIMKGVSGPVAGGFGI